MNKLAIDGGKPIRDKMLPYGRHHIDEDDIKAVIETLQSDFLTTGPQVHQFEDEFARITNANYAVSVSNCTAALHIACMAADIQCCDEVITSPITFAASANCIIYCGGKPVFADINANTYNIDPIDIERKITPKTKAVIPVHYTGESCEMEEIFSIAKKHKLIVIQDAAHALGGEYHGKKIGSMPDMTCFSLHPVKNITTGEGGVVTTDSEDLYKRLLLYRSHGITRNREQMTHDLGDWYYEQIALGYNYRLTDIQCALGLSQLKKLDTFNERRQKIVDFYNEQFAKIDGIQIRKNIENVKSGNHLYIIRLEPEKLTVSRNVIFNALRAENIGVNLHYIPIYLHPYYQNLGYAKNICPNAEYLYERLITLPLFPDMKNEDASDVVNAIQKVIGAYLK